MDPSLAYSVGWRIGAAYVWGRIDAGDTNAPPSHLFADYYAAHYVDKHGTDKLVVVSIAYKSYLFTLAAPVVTEERPVSLLPCETDNG